MPEVNNLLKLLNGYKLARIAGGIQRALKQCLLNAELRQGMEDYLQHNLRYVVE